MKNRVQSSKIELRFREVRSEGCTSCTPVLQALICFRCIFTALLRQSRFLLPAFPENWGARLRISGGCPARGEPEALINPCSSIACRAQPCQRCTPVLQALIYSLKMLKKPGNTPFSGLFLCPKFCLDCSVLADDGGAREPGVWFDPRVVGGGQGLLLCKRCGKSVGICKSLHMVCI